MLGNKLKIIFYVSLAWLLFFFLFLPKLLELPGVLEPWWTYKGLVYYKDFATFHFPLGRWVLLPFYLITDWRIEIGPWVGLLTGIATIIVLYQFGKRFLSPRATVFSLLFFSVFFWYLGTAIMFYHEMLIGLLLAGLLFIFYRILHSKKIKPVEIFSAGVVLSLAELSGQLATVTILTIGLLILSVLLTRYGRSKKFLKTATLLFLGIALPLSALSFYFLKANAFQDFFFWNFLYYTVYSSAYEKSSLLELPLKEVAAFYLPAITLGILLLRRRAIDTTVLFLISFSTLPLIVGSVYHPHHLSYALPILAVTTGRAYDLASAIKMKNVFYVGLVIFLALTFTTIFPWYTSKITYPPRFSLANDTYPGDNMYEAVGWVKTNTPSDAKILVAGDPLFYFRSDRLPANKHVYVSPFNWEPLSQVSKDVEMSPPNYWVIDRNFLKRVAHVYKKDNIVSFINQELENCYELEVAYESWEVWERTCP